MSDEERTLTSRATAHRIQRRWPVVSAIAALIVVIAFGVLITLRNLGAPLRIDTDWMREILEHRSPVWDVPSLIMNYVGGGLVGALILPVLIAGTLLLFRRYWVALFFVLSVALSAGLVQILKVTFGRARPVEMLVPSDFGSFPSGHVANAATMAIVFAILFPYVVVWIAGAAYTLLMALSRTYLGAHWLTDTVGGMILGACVAIIVWAPFAARIYDESRRSHRFVLLR